MRTAKVQPTSAGPVEKKYAAGQDVTSELVEGAQWVASAADAITMVPAPARRRKATPVKAAAGEAAQATVAVGAGADDRR